MCKSIEVIISWREFSEYWEYSENPSEVEQLANTNYLVYGPLPSQWTLSAENECTKIRYYGDFPWDELRNCQDFNGDS